MRSSYSLQLVLLSYVVAVLASHVTLSLAQRLRPLDGTRDVHRPIHWPWIVGGAFSMGTGIWSMHFIGMLAFHLPIQVVYDLGLTATSYVIAVVVSGFALHSFHRNDTTVRGIALPGVFIGCGISAMHYTGMAAMQMSPGIYYDRLLFATSVLIGIGAAMAALWIAFSLPQGQRGKRWHKLAAASVMGAAIVGMHYTGMAAANFAPNAVCISSGPRLDATWLAITISAFTFLILGSTLLLSVIDAQLQSTIARSAESLRIANEELEQRVLDRTAQLQAVNHKVQAQLARLKLLQQITHAIGERQDIHSIFQVVIRTLEEHLPVDFCCICLYDPAANCLIVTSVGLRSEALAMELAMTEQARIEIDENGLSQCVRGRLVYEPDITRVPFPFPQRLAGVALRSMVAAPLLIESRVFGVLIAARPEAHSFISGECEFLRQVSEHVALAAHQAQLYSALQQAYDDLRQTQKAVMQQERLLALGQMASGIAHDINNAISPVALYTESLLEREPGLSPRARSHLETIQRAIDDVALTVARMREFYRQRGPQLMLLPLDMNALVRQVVDLTRARWSDMAQQRGIAIEMRIELAPEVPAIMGADNEIREALTNLIFNAVDAMPDGGPLTLRTQVVRQFVQVEVIDAGIGMDEDTRRKCLEPFFTTKGERGTGLGLAMVYGAMQRHSADIEIESAVGRGTTLRLSFAIPTTPAVEVVVTPASAVPPLRILVVDDDPLVLQSLRDTLEAEGHGVTTADGGQAGIDAFLAAQAQGNTFPVVITDLGMPYVDGRKVSSAVKTAASGTIILLLTGWGQRLIAEGDIPPQVDRVLSKPPKLRELREALARCLDAQAS
jgi:NO-binding membrane sensor protein with MHYT domain/nitrogen-specific signal transduction histidine kinase/ActR/RegA family two-component response regulator